MLLTFTAHHTLPFLLCDEMGHIMYIFDIPLACVLWVYVTSEMKPGFTIHKNKLRVTIQSWILLKENYKHLFLQTGYTGWKLYMSDILYGWNFRIFVALRMDALERLVSCEIWQSDFLGLSLCLVWMSWRVTGVSTNSDASSYLLHAVFIWL